MNKVQMTIVIKEHTDISCTYCGGQFNPRDTMIIQQDFQTLQTELLHKECYEGDK